MLAKAFYQASLKAGSVMPRWYFPVYYCLNLEEFNLVSLQDYLIMGDVTHLNLA